MTSSMSVNGTGALSPHCVEVHRNMLTAHLIFGPAAAAACSRRETSAAALALSAATSWRLVIQISSCRLFHHALGFQMSTCHFHRLSSCFQKTTYFTATGPPAVS